MAPPGKEDDDTAAARALLESLFGRPPPEDRGRLMDLPDVSIPDKLPVRGLPAPDPLTPGGRPPPPLSGSPDMGDLEKGWASVDRGDHEEVMAPFNRRTAAGAARTAVKRQYRYGVKRVTEIRDSDKVVGESMTYGEATEAAAALNGVLRDVMDS